MVGRQARSQIEELIDDDEGQVWLITYSDMMTLILVFFILLYTIFYIETERFKDAIATVQVESDDGTTMNVIQYAEQAVRKQGQIRLEEATGLRQRRSRMLRELQSIVADNDWGSNVEAFTADGKLTLRVKGEALFTSGEAELDGAAYAIFDQIIATLQKYPDYRISIKGHTDDLPISNHRFTSNWELSAVRATTALRYFLDQGVDPARMTATGYADLLPLKPNDTAENRAQNRRVEFVLEKEAL